MSRSLDMSRTWKCRSKGLLSSSSHYCFKASCAHERTTLFRIHVLEPTLTIYLDLTHSRLCPYVCPKIYVNIELAVFSLNFLNLTFPLEIFHFHFSSISIILAYHSSFWLIVTSCSFESSNNFSRVNKIKNEYIIKIIFYNNVCINILYIYFLIQTFLIFKNLIPNKKYFSLKILIRIFLIFLIFIYLLFVFNK